jgi:predicted nuclease of predicted toxin-antitoxin system
MAARFKVDENLPREAQTLLLDAGHDAHTVHDERLVGHPDSTIFDICLNEDRVLVTLDLDFADIRQYPPSSHRGIWVLRPETQSIENTLSVLRGALALVGVEPTTNRLWIAEPGRVRIRE